MRGRELLDDAPQPPEGRAAQLLREAQRIHARHPQSSLENIWHTLWLLEMSPAERLNRSLIRGRAGASTVATDRPKDRAILPALGDALRVLQSRKRRTAPTRRTKGRRPKS